MQKFIWEGILSEYHQKKARQNADNINRFYHADMYEYHHCRYVKGQADFLNKQQKER